MTLAEIIEEHDKLETLRKDAGSGYWYANTMALRHFYCDHFASLLAIARAAVEMRGATPQHEPVMGCCDACWAYLAFDGVALRDAVRGEGKEKANG